MDPWELVRSFQRQLLSLLAFMVSLMVFWGGFALLAPDLLEPSLLPMMLMSGVAAVLTWRWSGEHL